MPNLGAGEFATSRLAVLAGAAVVVVTIVTLAVVLIQGGGGGGVLQVKFKEAQLNFSVESENISAEDLVALMLEGKRGEIVAAYLERQGKLYRYGSPALLDRVKTENAKAEFAANIRDLLSLEAGPFSCCHSFVNLSNAKVVRKILQLPYNSPTAELLRAKAREYQGIFRDEGRRVQIGIFKNHDPSIAAACRTADFFGRHVQVYSRRGTFVTVQVVKSFDCEREDFQYRDSPSLFLQLGPEDSKELFGERDFARTEPAFIIISPEGFAPSAPVVIAKNKKTGAKN